MEELFSNETGTLSLFLLFASLGIFGLFARNIFELLKIGKEADKAIKDRETFIKVQSKNEALKENILEDQTRRNAEIKVAVELIPDGKNAETDHLNDSLVNEWNKKFDKGE